MTAASPTDGRRTDDPQSPRALVAERLAALRAEFEAGQARLREVEQQEAFLRERLLMLRGAVQAVEQLHADLFPDADPTAGG
jgi:predicted nuclease with TOPRIM domain